MKTQKFRGELLGDETLISEEEVLPDHSWRLWSWKKDPVGVGPKSLRWHTSPHWLVCVSKALQTLENPQIGFGSCHRKNRGCWSGEVLLWWHWEEKQTEGRRALCLLQLCSLPAVWSPAGNHWQSGKGLVESWAQHRKAEHRRVGLDLTDDVTDS